MRMFSDSFLAAFFLLRIVAADWTFCGTNGVSVCSNTDQKVIVNNSLWLSGCTYVGCPAIVVQANAVLSISNSQFLNVLSTELCGGTLQIIGGTVNLSNVTFQNLTAPSGAAICGTSNSVIIAQDLLFVSNSATDSSNGNGADILVDSSTFTCDNCSSIGANALNGGMMFIADYSIANWNGGHCDNANAAELGACVYLDTSSLNIMDVSINNTVAADGAISITSQGAVFNAVNLVIENCYGTYSAGAFYIFQYPIVSISQSKIINSNGIYGGFAVAQDHVKLLLQDTIIDNAYSSSLTDSGNLYIFSNCNVTFQNVTFSNSNAQYGGAISAVDSFVNIYDSHLFGNTVRVSGAALYMNGVAALVIENTKIENNNAPQNGGGIFITDVASADIKNVKFIANTASIGGAICASASSPFLIGSECSFHGNVARTYGGAISLNNPASNVRFYGTGHLASGNIANITGAFAAIFCSSLGDFNVQSVVGTLPDILDDIYVDQAITGEMLLAHKITSVFTSALVHGRASILNVTNPEAWTNLGINYNQFLPDLSIVAIDIFGNVAPVNRQVPIIAKVVVNDESAITGASIAAILDSVTNSFTFSSLQVSELGQHTLSLQGIEGNLDRTPDMIWRNFTINVVGCLKHEIFSQENQICVPLINADSTTRIVIGLFAIAILVVVLGICVKLIKYREMNIIKISSFGLMLTMCSGCILMVIGIIVQMVPYQSSCTISIAFDNIGFLLFFSSIMARSIRIKEVSFQKYGKVGKEQSDRSLLLKIGALFLLLLVFLIIWFNESSPEPILVVDSTFANNDRCQYNSVYGTIIILVRVAAIFYSTYLTGILRNLPKTIHETSHIATSMYNWFVFGALLNLLAQFVIQDSKMAFILLSISTLVPTSISAVLICGVKVHTCMKDPDQANAPITTDIVSSGSDGKSSSTKQSSSSQASKKLKLNAKQIKLFDGLLKKMNQFVK